FDLTDLTGPVQSAKLRVFAALSSTQAKNLKLGVYYARGATWEQNSITFNNRPLADSTFRASAIVNDNAAQWYNLDLTDLINAELASGQTFFTFVLKNLATSATGTIIHSSESSSNQPELAIIA